MLSPYEINRRAFLGRSAGGGLGMIALAHLLGAEDKARGAVEAPRGLPAARLGATSKPAASNVIVLFQNGGPSQVDLFDPKPELTRLSGQPFPRGKVETLSLSVSGNLLGSPFKFAPAGQSGLVLSEILPHTARIADDITLVRSMVTESVCHETALRIAHSGNDVAAGRPSLGSWVYYALGSENENLPAFVVLPDPGGLPINGVLNWSSGWLPAFYQGTSFNSSGSPVLNLETPTGTTAAARRNQLRLLDTLNREHSHRYPEDSDLAARIANFEIAARMQSAVPEAVDLSRETEATRRLYGLDNPVTQSYGTRVLLARRLVEHGVRFVGVYLKSQPWDTHNDNANATKGVCQAIDQPSAALVQDLKQRGLLESTIVLWMGEFGRTPISQGANGRDHSRRGFSIWAAGGGFKGGYAHGGTDEFGYESIDNVVTVHDLHATVLQALGLDHHKLVYAHDGRLASLTDAELTGAKVVPELLV
jgi:hypothetical protein